jgi:hypothetical protein
LGQVFSATWSRAFRHLLEQGRDVTVEELTTVRSRNAVDGDGPTDNFGENKDG